MCDAENAGQPESAQEANSRECGYEWNGLLQ
jgi:hypothetical protein